MSISSLLRVLWRHPAVVGAVALVSVLGLVGIMVKAPPTYRASAAVVLLNPPAVPTATATRPDIPAQYQNPYVRFGDLSVVVDILVRITGSQEVVSSLKGKGLEGTFTVAANRDFYRGPIVDVAAEATSGAAAINDTKIVIKEIQDQLVALQTQQRTDPSYFIRAELVVGADRATTVLSGTLRLLIVAAGFGGILTIGSGLLADAIERRRGSRRLIASHDPAEDHLSDSGATTDGGAGSDVSVSGASDDRRGSRATGRAHGKARKEDAVQLPAAHSTRMPPSGTVRQESSTGASLRDSDRNGEPVNAADRASTALAGTLPERPKTPSDRRRAQRLNDPGLQAGATNGSASTPAQRKKPRRAADTLVPNDDDELR